tara:strand:- start:400 stop:1056 length:657 start_codon:yes stop_codon:yes gene_type:complete
MQVTIEENFDILKPFGPSVLKVKIPENIVNTLNDYIDKTISDNQKANDLNLGNKLAGDVTQEFKLEQEFMTKSGWTKFLAESVQKWMWVEQKKKLTRFDLINSWIVRQFKDEYNPIHWHSGHISGAGFLKVPRTFGKHVQDDKGNKEYLGGRLTLVHGVKQFLSNAKLQIKPEVGDFYFFPHYLMHTVYPFKGTDDERRSISFNALIDDKIFNVYGND